eukprot:jgi/Astpho2/5864/gw1.00080.23.1_t
MTFAAILGDVDTMKTLLLRGLPVNTADYDGRTTLHLAALEGNVKVLEVLLQNGADPMVRDRYEDASRHLCAAADTGDMRQLTRLIDNGVDANVRDYDQRTALHIAARRGLLTVVEYLISLKAEINVVDSWRLSTVPGLAARAQAAEAAQGVRLVPEKGTQAAYTTDVDDSDYHQRTALHLAASNGHIAMVRHLLLISNGMDPNTSDYNQRTPLHLAASNGHVHIVQFLCSQQGINLGAVDGMGNTPLMDAIRHGHTEVQAALRAA